jgi:hypothetical protein
VTLTFVAILALSGWREWESLGPPSEHVTVSLGGATDLPAGGAADHTSLIEVADLVLYADKDGGRDRLIMSAQIIAWPKAKTA